MLRGGTSLLGIVNVVTFLISIPIPILGDGIWLASRANTIDCIRFLQWPIIVIGLTVMVISLMGFVGTRGAAPKQRTARGGAMRRRRRGGANLPGSEDGGVIWGSDSAEAGAGDRPSLSDLAGEELAGAQESPMFADVVTAIAAPIDNSPFIVSSGDCWCW